MASLIRQESEFDPSAVSYANAYGLMQMLPSVGRTMAREEGMTHFQTFQLLDPATNIRLGTRYLRQMLDRFGGVQEYALAAYNAGDNRVADWQAAGPYQASTSLWNRFRSRRRASMSRPSCAMRKLTGRSTRLRAPKVRPVHQRPGNLTLFHFGLNGKENPTCHSPAQIRIDFGNRARQH